MDERNPGGDATGLLKSMDDELSLNRAENLGALIRKFIAQTLEAVHHTSAGRISRELGVATVQANCSTYARQLTGSKDSKYTIDGGWFPKGVAAHLRTELDVEGDDEKVISEAFASIAHHVFEIAQMDNEKAAQKAIDELIRASVLLLSGINHNAAD